MAPSRPRSLRRSARRPCTVLLAVVLCLLAWQATVPGTGQTPGGPVHGAAAAASTAPSYDASVGAAACALLGRAYLPSLGCARSECVAGAVPWRRTPGAEACALPGQPEGYGYGATVPASVCTALHRRWVAAVNYCASEPDRSARVVPDAPQCVPPATTYVVRSEKPGRYDACVPAGQLAAVPALERSVAPTGDVLLVGDSVGWRGSDELTRLDPSFAVDAQPGRRPSQLTGRLRSFRVHVGRPAGVVVELGTNPAPGFGRRDLALAVRRVPPATPVLLVLPYVGTAHGQSPWTRRVDGWMRSVADSRAGTCVADWPAYVRARPGLLQDGIHTVHPAEGQWAAWIDGEWRGCA